MKSKSHWLAASVAGVVIFFGEFGCLLDSNSQNTAAESQEQSSVNTNDYLNVRSISKDKIVIYHDKTNPVSMVVPHHSAKEINAILLTGCEREPDEIVVPLNVDKQKTCHKVKAEAIHADSDGVAYLEADYFWSIDDASVVQMVGGKAIAEQPSIVLEALHDIYSGEDLTEEPRTMLTVCATPKGGWQDPNHPPLCRSVPVYAVANMEGSWCFEGNTITPDKNSDCHAVYIWQDGRFLTIETGENGTIYEKQLDFWYEGLNYRSVQSTTSQMWGIVAAGEDMMGTFSAFRLPL